MAFKKVEVEYENSEIVKFEEEGQEFVGIYRGYQDWKNENGEGRFYKFEDPDDDEVNYTIYESAVLKTKMPKVPLDALVKIVYLGKKPSKRNKSQSYRDYDIFIDDAD